MRRWERKRSKGVRRAGQRIALAGKGQRVGKLGGQVRPRWTRRRERKRVVLLVVVEGRGERVHGRRGEREREGSRAGGEGGGGSARRWRKRERIRQARLHRERVLGVLLSRLLVLLLVLRQGDARLSGVSASGRGDTAALLAPLGRQRALVLWLHRRCLARAARRRLRRLRERPGGDACVRRLKELRERDDRVRRLTASLVRCCAAQAASASAVAGGEAPPSQRQAMRATRRKDAVDAARVLWGWAAIACESSLSGSHGRGEALSGGDTLSSRRPPLPFVSLRLLARELAWDAKDAQNRCLHDVVYASRRLRLVLPRRWLGFCCGLVARSAAAWSAVLCAKWSWDHHCTSAGASPAARTLRFP